MISDKQKLWQGEKLIKEAAQEHKSKIKMNKCHFKLDWTSIGRLNIKATGTAYWQTIHSMDLNSAGRIHKQVFGGHWCQKDSNSLFKRRVYK